MRMVILLMAMFMVVSCTLVEVGKISDERKHLYDHNNNEEYCQKNPDRCVNNIPW